MAHEVETMMYTREVPWHGLGTRVEEAPNSAEAIRLAGLDWEVVPKPLFLDDGRQIPGYVANTRTSDNSVLGVVSEKYKIVQNKEAFSFTDNIIGGDVRYETAGSLKNGKSVWLLAHLPKTSILGDDVIPYLCFNNSHDGQGAIRVFMTPIRVVCNNTLNIVGVEAENIAKNIEYIWNRNKEEDLFYKVLSDECGECIADDYQLLGYIKDFSENKKRFAKIKSALEDAENGGYGVVLPTVDEMNLEEPEIFKKGGR